MTLESWITDAANKTPDKTAIEFEGQHLTYGSFADRIKLRVAQLTAKGIGHGDRIAWLGYNNPEVFILLFAAARMGAILVPLNWRLAKDELSDILTDCAPKLVFHDADFADVATDLAPKLATNIWDSNSAYTENADHSAKLSDPLLIVYTSGSTGKPKGVVLNQQALATNAFMSIECHGLQPSDTVLNTLPLFHVGGLNILPTPAFSIGASLILHRNFVPELLLKDLQRVQATILVPTILGALIAHKDWTLADFSKLRLISIGSTDVPANLIEAVHKRGIPLAQIYGATETAPFAIYQRFDTAIETAGSIGASSKHCAIKIALPDGTEAPVGSPGEIWVKGQNTLLGYWQNQGLTEEAISKGWFKTGDVARVDDQGNYWFKDRIKHVIISGGENIYPAEIERVLRENQNIAEASVVGEPHPKWGQVAVAVIVRNGPVSKHEILSNLENKLARYKHPKRLVFVDTLPRNAMGKVVVAEVKRLL